jgi:hypothetical protein
MERRRQHNTIRHPSNPFVLPRHHGQVDHDPEDQSRPHFVEAFDVEVAETGVEGTTDKPLQIREGSEEGRKGE